MLVYTCCVPICKQSIVYKKQTSKQTNKKQTSKKNPKKPQKTPQANTENNRRLLNMELLEMKCVDKQHHTTYKKKYHFH
jgi:hypothetical protein